MPFAQLLGFSFGLWRFFLLFSSLFSLSLYFATHRRSGSGTTAYGVKTAWIYAYCEKMGSAPFLPVPSLLFFFLSAFRHNQGG